MLMSYLLAASFTAVIASATPLTRSIGPGCRSFPTNGVDTLLDFTLVAQYDSDTSIHKQLVLGADGSDPAPNITFVGSIDSIQTPLGQNFTMAHSGVTAQAVGGNLVPKISTNVTSGDFLPFISQYDGAPTGPAEVYCELVSTSPNGSPYPDPLLSVDDDADNFFICNSTSSSQQNIVYDPVQASATTYDFNSCERVHILIVQ